MAKLEALTTVYSYMFPEVKEAVFEAMLPELVQQIKIDPAGRRIVSTLEHDGDLLKAVERAFSTGYLSGFLQQPQEMDGMHIPILIHLRSGCLPCGRLK